MNWELCFMSTLLSTILITLMLWYTTEKENGKWKELGWCLKSLQDELEGNNLDKIKLHIDKVDFHDELMESIDNCIEILESKLDDKKDNDHYYNQNGIEAWDIIDQVMEFHEGNISNKEAGILYNMMKYLLRFPYKGQWNSDLDKICVYAQELKNGDD